MSTYTLVKGNKYGGYLRHHILQSLDQPVMVGAYACLYSDHTEIPYEPKSAREFNHHKSGEAYFNRRVEGGYGSSVKGPGDSPIDFNAAYTYTKTLEERAGQKYQVFIEETYSRQSASLLGSVQLTSDGWVAGGWIDALRLGYNDHILEEESWYPEPNGWWRAGGGYGFQYHDARPRAFYTETLDGAVYVLQGIVHDFASLPLEDAYARHCTGTRLPVQFDYSNYIYKGNASQGEAAFDDTFCSFSRCLSYDQLKTADRAGLCQAYLKAIEGIPSLSGMNNLENALQCIALAKDIIVSKGKPAKIGKLPKELRNVWLATRYSLGTSVSDVNEVGEYISRAADLIGSTVLKSDGYYESDGSRYHVVLTWLPQGLKTLQSPLERAGLNPSASNLWDLIPYSFVVDWFLQIGNMLEFEETRQLALRAQPADSWMSIDKKGSNAQEHFQTEFIRIPGIPSASDLTWLPDYQWRHPSGKTIAKRAVDAAALFLPKGKRGNIQ